MNQSDIFFVLNGLVLSVSYVGINLIFFSIPVHIEVRSRALDPHSFFADPDPAFFQSGYGYSFFLNADPDLALKINL